MKMFIEPSDIHLHRLPVDFRKSINGLALIVEYEMALPVMSGALFLFCNRAKDKIKILYWDKTGFALWYKRLEKHKFKWPNSSNDQAMELTQQQLAYLLDGFDIVGHQALHYDNVAL